MMGLFGGGAASAQQFNPDMSGFRSSIDRVNRLADTPITGSSQSGQVELGLIDKDRQKSLTQLQAAQAGRLNTGINSLALSGGVTGGARERLASQGQAQGGMFAQGLLGDFAAERGASMARDFGQQQQFQNQAIFAAPGMEQSFANTQAEIAAANQQAQAAAGAGKKKMLGGIGSMLGTAAGTAFGGPVGGALGGALGGGLFSSFG